jgi:hypothetical protein
MKVYFFPSSAASSALSCSRPVEVFQEEHPGGLLGVIQLSGATGFFAEDVVDVFEGLFKHERRRRRLSESKEDAPRSI